MPRRQRYLVVIAVEDLHRRPCALLYAPSLTPDATRPGVVAIVMIWVTKKRVKVNRGASEARGLRAISDGFPLVAGDEDDTGPVAHVRVRARCQRLSAAAQLRSAKEASMYLAWAAP